MTLVEALLGKFLAGSDWYPSEKSFGLWPMIVGSLYVMNVGLDEVFNPKLREL